MANAKKKKIVPQYRIHNIVRKVEGRLTRAKQARRTRMNMLLGGGLLRIPRNRHVTVAEPMVRRLLAELIKKESAGGLKVTTLDGRRVDLKTLKPLEQVKKAAPPPNPPLDSAADDKTYEHGVGEGMPQMPGAKALEEDVKVPEVLDNQIPEGKDPEPPEEPEVTEAEVTPEELAEAAQAIYDGGWSHKQLREEVAPEYKVIDLSGNKMALAERLAAAGMRIEDYEENGD